MEVLQQIILFDGYCNLCNGFIDFLVKRDKKGQLIYIPLQSAAGKELVQKFKLPEDLDSVIFIAGEKFFTESNVVLEIVRVLPSFWKLFFVFRIIPNSVRNKIYRFIATKRYRWWGRRDSCRIL